MNDRSILNIHFETGITSISNTIKKLLYQCDASIFDRIDFDNEDFFTEPMLFGFVTRKKEDITLDQISFGYTKPAKRKGKIKVFVTKQGVIYLPKYGYLHVGNRNEQIDLFWDNDLQAISLQKEGKPIAYSMEHLLYLRSAPSIEVLLYSNPIYTDVLEGWEDDEQETIERSNNLPSYRENILDNYNNYIRDIKPVTLGVVDNLDRAFDLIKKNKPDEFERYCEATKRVICYDNPLVRGFATKKVHGSVFFSVEENCRVITFLDEIVHQCSHSVFNMMTLPINEYILIDENTPLAELSSNPLKKEERGFYDAYHGLYTITSIIYALIPVYRNTEFSIEDKFELLGRISKRGKMIKTGVDKIKKEEVLTEDGIEIFDFLIAQSDKIIAEHPDIFDKFDFSNQPYTYSFEKFKEINDLEGAFD